jgi:hypothetical protein
VSKEFTNQPDQHPEFVELPETWGLGPGHVELSGAHEYGPPEGAEHIVAPVDATREHQTERALEYLHRVLPGVDAELISTGGNFGIVLGDQDTAYKILRQQPLNYGVAEDEAAAHSRLGEEGLSSELRALIDAAPEHRSRLSHTTRLFDGQQPIVRVDGEGAIPIIATERQNIAPISDLPTEKIPDEFARFANVILQDGIDLNDVELYYDRDQGQAIALDLGKVRQVPRDLPAGNGLILNNLLTHFAPHIEVPTPSEIEQILAQNGLDGVTALLRDRLQQTETD